ncbi:MAG TPA: cytochrome C oxidase subunit IV family protein [Paludibacter sp.]|nr:cytochrome C oxidase subunit IV family protein [Paludibacter sp.]
MANNTSHITGYLVLAKVLLVLMLLVFITVTVTSLSLAPYSIMIALLIAGVKSFLVLSYFMHLRYETLALKLLVGMVFLLYAALLVFTFVDYAFR